MRDMPPSDKPERHAPQRPRVLSLVVLFLGALGLLFTIAPSWHVTAENAVTDQAATVTAEQPLAATAAISDADTGILDVVAPQQDPKLPKIPTNIPQLPVPETPKPGSQKGFGRFSHTSPGNHAGFARAGSCNSCHSRAGLAASLPGHNACDKCHNFPELQPTQFCGICHTTAPAVKTVTRSRSFSSFFSHVSHARGAGRPAQGCAACHKPTGASQTIPAFALNTHAMCYSCHTQGSRIGDCSECHRSGGRNPWKGGDGGRAEKGFTHVTHGARQGLSCDECHTTQPGPAGRQVTEPVAQQHFPGKGKTCASCHNDKPTFGEKDFGDCKKCHKAAASFRL